MTPLPSLLPRTDRAGAARRPALKPLTAALAVLCAALAAPPGHSQIVAAPDAPGGQRPVVLTAPNGVPLVNIQTPSAAGVSRNVYQQFNVDAQGAILNNSRTNAQTQLGGWVQGNPYLAGGGARIILNEVNGGDPSRLRGYLEVAGQRAEVVIANPAGISVDGGGFINASRATLTTGTPQLSAIGGLDGFLVRGGTIRIEGKGLDLSRTDYAAILARAVQANAGIWAGELKVVTGANRIDADHRVAETVAGSGAAPAYALDVAALGGMYAGKIALIGTEAGLGVRNAGTVQAAAQAGVALAGAGQLVVTSAGRLENLGTLQGASDANLSASALSNGGRVSSGGNLKIATQGDLSNAAAGKGGVIEGGRLDLGSAAGDLDNRGGTLRQTSAAGLVLNAPKLSNAGGTIGREPIAQTPNPGTDPGTPGGGTPGGGTPGGGTPGTGTPGGEPGGGIVVPPYVPASPGAIAAAGAVRNDGGRIYLGGAIELNSADLDNRGGSLSVARMNLIQPRFDNRGGTLDVSEAFNARVEQFDNRGGKLNAGRLNIAASGDVLNEGGSLSSGGDAALEAGGRFDNARGALTATGTLAIAAAGAVDNRGGTLAANRDFALAAGALANAGGAIQSAQGDARLSLAGAFDNGDGQIAAARDLSVTAREASHRGQLRAGNDASLTFSAGLSNDGAITAGRHLNLSAGSLSGGAGGVLGAGVQADGKLGAAGDLSVRTSGALAAHGTQLAAGGATLDGGAGVDVSGGQTSAANVVLRARQGDVNARKANVVASGRLSVEADAADSQSLLNEGGRLQAGQLDLRAGVVRNNQGGEIVQTGTAAALIAARGALSNDGGRIAVNATDLSLLGASIGNAGGKIEHAGSGALKIAGGRFDGDNGQIAANGALLVDLSGAFHHDGGKAGAKQVSIQAGSLSNRGGQIVHSGDGEARVSVAGALDNDGGAIAANAAARIQANSLSNRGGSLRAAENSDLRIDVAQTLDNGGNGDIAAGRDTLLRAGAIDNRGGRIAAVGDLDVDARTALSNAGGTLAANGNTRLSAERLDNSGGTLAAVRGGLQVATASATRNDGGKLQAGGAVTLNNGGFSNVGGQVFGDSVSIDTRGQALDNRGKGVIAATQGMDLRSGALDNDTGLIQSGKALRIDTGGASLTNTHAAGGFNGQGGISSGDTLTLVTGAFDNRAGSIAAKRALQADTGAFLNRDGGTVLGEAGVVVDTHGAGYDNRGGQTLAKGDLTLRAGAIDNTGALIRSLGIASLQAGSVINAATQGAGQGIEGRDVIVVASALDNRNGAIRADRNATLVGGGRIDNGGGLMSAGDTLAILDPNRAIPGAKTLELVNTGGTLVADKNLLIDAAGFSGDGRVLSNQDLSIALSRDVTQTGEVAANGDLRYATAGTLIQQGKLAAGRTLTVNAATLDNRAGAEIVGGTTVVGAGHVVNRGLIDGRDTRIDAGTLDNIGTGRIYGDTVSIGAGTINNDAETVGGAIKAGTIAARANLDIGAGTINNREHALIFSGGDMVIGGALDAQRRATGRGATLNNLSAEIESLGDMAIAMAQINNHDVHLRKGPTTHPAKPPLIAIAPIGGDRMYLPEEVIYAPGSPFVYERNPDGTPGRLLSSEGYGLWTTVYAVTEDTAVDADPSRIVSGGDMLLDGSVHNRSSRIVAGGDLVAVGGISNEGLNGDRNIKRVFTVINHEGKLVGGGALSDINETFELNKYEPQRNVNAVQGYNPGAAGATGVNAATGGAGAVGGAGAQAMIEVPANVGGVSRASGAAAGAANGAAGGAGTDGAASVPMVVRTRSPDATVPRASLFGLRPDSASRYLIETDPRFTDQRRWLSSDYLLSRLGMDGNLTQKRLGDGFYEQKLIREQIAQLTGYRYLEGFGSDEAQYAALMNAGATFAAQYGLRPGVALSAAQMAQLTSDIVWLVEQTVSLPDGGTQRVLVPQVYVRVRPGDIDGSGALLSGNTTRIQSAGDLVNTSTIAGRQLLAINAQNIDNLGGRLDGGQVNLNARNDLNNLGGSITARDAAILTAGNDINLRTTTRDATGLLTGSNIDRVASIYVANPGGILLASAGRDVNLAAAQVANAGAGSRTLVNAGRDVNLGTVTEGYSAYATGRSGNTRASGIAAHTNEVGSTILGGGSVAIAAGHDVNARAAQVGALGTLAVNAGNDIRIDVGTRADSVLTTQESSGRKMLVRSSSSKLDVENSVGAIGSRLSGQDVILSAGNDLIVRGSEVAAERQAVLSAGRDVRIESAQEYKQTASFSSSKSSGLSRGIAEGINYTSNKASQYKIGNGVSQVGSTIAGADISIDAGRDAQIVASKVLADRNVAIAAGRNIDILAAYDTNNTIAASDKNDLSRNLKPGAAPSQTLYSRTYKGEDGTGQTSKAVTSTISATGGSVSLIAGVDGKYRGTGQGNVTSEGANLLAKDRVSISGNAVNLMAATSTELSTKHSRSTGHTVGAELSGTVGGKITALYKQIEKARTSTDEREQAAAALKAGYDAYKFANDGIGKKVAGGVDQAAIDKAVAAGSTDAAMANSPSGAAFGVSVSESRTRSREDSASASTRQRGTEIQAGRIDITARESDINIQGGKLQASDILLDAARDVNLFAAQNTSATLGTSSGSSFGGGATFGFGSQNGVSIQVSMGGSRGRTTGFEVVHDNTRVTATDSLTIKSGRDTNLRGAQLAGETVKLDVGRDLNIETLQDVTQFSSDKSSRGLDLSLCIPPICYGQFIDSASIKYSSESVDHNYRSAGGQSGITAGSGGYDIRVRGNTDLVGGAIVSTAAPDKNLLTTASLTSRDLQNLQNTNSSSTSLGLSFSSGSNAYVQGPSLSDQLISNASRNVRSNLAAGSNGLPADGEQRSQTLSVIGPGRVVVTGTGNAEIDGRSAETVATVTARDPKTAHDPLKNTLTLQQAAEIPKRQKEAAERQALADKVGGVISGAIGDISGALNKELQDQENKRAELAKEDARKISSWADGSIEKTAMHSLAGFIQAKIAQGNLVAGAATGALNEQLAPEMAKLLLGLGVERDSVTFKELMKIGSTLLGVAVGTAAGGRTDVEINAAVASNGTAQNFLKHDQVAQMKREFDDCKAQGNACGDEQIKAIASRYMALSQQNIDKVRAYIRAGDVAAVAALEGQAATAAAVDDAIPFGYGDVSKVFQGWQNNVNLLGTVGGVGAIGGTDVQQATEVAQFRRDYCVGISSGACDAKVQQALDDRATRYWTLTGISASVQIAVPLAVRAVGGLRPPAPTSAPTPTSVGSVRVGDRDVEVAGRGPVMLRRNPETGVYEPLEEVPVAVPGPGLPVPRPGTQTPPATTPALPAPAGYVIMPMRDSSGTSIPVVLATEKFSWGPTNPNDLIGSQSVDHERAAVRYILSTEQVVTILDTRSSNANGFDPSYIKKTPEGGYQLVLVEDKSGRMDAITAFGEGHTGEQQLIKNLDAMRAYILADKNLSEPARISAIDQIDRRTFQVQLFVGPTSNPRLSTLDNARKMTRGTSSLYNIVVLPRAPGAIKQ
ncbi:hemagglutinin repeat-containing protein [Lysobacter sp. K5869]|uniref:two-partner secretion domain-containing protein n=1 Tax=Lysobacter sp. K5869 TaxID=2820808 RepID=UPI001C063A38|nr:hemagglutinin repeat-containing protein [Lysobacter sp. K5869]QWP74826.1 hemagglutinin repeat-containing protein [Lysobacter sp. K5869]